MNVYLSEGMNDQIPGDLIVRAVLRSDLTPIPRTVEMTVQVKNGIEERLAVGRSFWCGREVLEYEIVKVKRLQGTGVIQGNDQLAAFTVFGVMKLCAKVSYRRDRAVVRYGGTFGEIYRACGASVGIGNDFEVERFVCLKGQVPSYHLATALQDEGAALVWRDNRISAIRLTDMVRQEPVDIIGQVDSTDLEDSEFMERHEIPSFYSTDDTGAFVFGDLSKTRALRFMPRTPERQLVNASRVLVRRRTVDSDLAQQIQAGDMLQIGEEKCIVITAAHDWTYQQGIAETKSRFFVGGLPK